MQPPAQFLAHSRPLITMVAAVVNDSVSSSRTGDLSFCAASSWYGVGMEQMFVR